MGNVSGQYVVLHKVQHFPVVVMREVVEDVTPLGVEDAHSLGKMVALFIERNSSKTVQKVMINSFISPAQKRLIQST